MAKCARDICKEASIRLTDLLGDVMRLKQEATNAGDHDTASYLDDLLQDLNEVHYLLSAAY